jgi:YidC/Oxa1 family membrane protein insertase
MDKKSLIGLGLIAAILITWLALTGPSKEQIARNKQIKDSVELATKAAQVAEEAKLAAKKLAIINDTTAKVVVSDSMLQAQKSSFYKDFAVSADGKAEVVTIENENIKVFISTKGGDVEKVILKNYKRYGSSDALILFDKDSTIQSIQFEAYANNMSFNTDSFYFKPSSLTDVLFGNNS